MKFIFVKTVILKNNCFTSVVGGRCDLGMARPQVANRGDRHQMWMEDIWAYVNEQSRTADKGWSSSLGVGRGSNKPHPIEIVTKQAHKLRNWSSSLVGLVAYELAKYRLYLVGVQKVSDQIRYLGSLASIFTLLLIFYLPLRWIVDITEYCIFEHS